METVVTEACQYTDTLPSLLSIPEELLDQIIEYVLLDESLPPLDLACAKQSGKCGIGQEHCSVCRIRHESITPMANVTSLLPVNQQLNKQTRSVVVRLFPDGVDYRLDVITVGQELWPTWLSVPVTV